MATTAEQLETILRRAEAARDTAYITVAERPNSSVQDDSMLQAVSLLFDAVLALTDFYNQRLRELQQAVEILHNSLEGE